MSQLFDAHPQLYAHPDELSIGWPRKRVYPDLDLTQTPDFWFSRLLEPRTVQHLHMGYKKSARSSEYDALDVFPFLFLPNLQREIFLKYVAEWYPASPSQRTILDAYMTSYFNAWLDYQGIYQDKKYITAFVPRVAEKPDNVARYLRDYPDGRLIQIIREPKGWYVSSRQKGPKAYATPQLAMPRWIASADAILNNRREYPDKVFVTSFDTLIRDTEGLMRKLAGWLEVDWHPTLAEPTFQGQSIKANTSFGTSQYGVISAPLERAHNLSPDDAQAVDALAGDRYQQILAISDYLHEGT